MSSPTTTATHHPPRTTAWYKFSRFLPLLICALSLGITYELQNAAQKKGWQVLQTEFGLHSKEALERIEKRMIEYSQTLRGLDGVINHAGLISRGAFRSYVTAMQLETYYPGVQAIGYALIVPPGNKSRHIAAIRVEGYSSYTIFPPGEREIFTPNIYIEPPSERNLRAFGYDPYSEPTRRIAMERARDSGQIAITSKLKLVQETDQNVQAGFLMFQPVYRPDMPHDTLATRRANIMGWIFASFRMNDLMEGIHGSSSRDVGAEIYDGDTKNDAALMYDPDNHHSRNVQPLFESVHRIEIASHPWTLEIYSQPDFDAQLDKDRARLIAAVGTGFSLLLGALIWLLVSNKERMLRDLLDKQKRIASALEFQKFTLDQHAIVSITDVRGDITYANDKFCDISGYTQKELLGSNHRIIKSGIHPGDYYAEMWRSIAAGQIWQGEFCNRNKSGGLYWVNSTIVPFLNEEGQPWQYIAVRTDITPLKAAQENLSHMAHFDPLTDLPNRALFSDRLHQALAVANRSRTRLAVIFIDLDEFKPINDTLGHAIGDLLLKEAAKRLQECVRDSDTAARIGGDEFVVLLSAIEAEQDALGVAEKIRHAFNQPFGLAGQSLRISSSIGVAIYPEHGNDEKVLLRNADIAMYHAKHGGRNIVMLYRPAMQEIQKTT